MNDKHYVLVVKRNPAENKPLPVKIAFVRPANDIGQTNDAFAVDWQLEGSSAFSENNFTARFHKNATGITNDHERRLISFVHPRLKPNK